jgi:hypothetical protein
METTERIEQMEQRFDRAKEMVQTIAYVLEQYESLQEDIQLLDAYLGSEEWKADLAADEAGLLPTGLKRGVLSEDGIWNLLEEWRDLQVMLAQKKACQFPHDE